jgi:hypothetical protein
MKSNLRLNYNSAMLRVCVDDIDGSVVSGRVFSRRLKEALFFSDWKDFVLSLDRLMDEQNYPQAFQRRRTFKPAAQQNKDATPEEDDRPYLDAETVDRAVGRKTTFLLQILTRRNANWQGFVAFSDGSKHEFESELDFLALVNEFLSI